MVGHPLCDAGVLACGLLVQGVEVVDPGGDAEQCPEAIAGVDPGSGRNGVRRGAVAAADGFGLDAQMGISVGGPARECLLVVLQGVGRGFRAYTAGLYVGVEDAGRRRRGTGLGALDCRAGDGGDVGEDALG